MPPSVRRCSNAWWYWVSAIEAVSWSKKSDSEWFTWYEFTVFEKRVALLAVIGTFAQAFFDMRLHNYSVGREEIVTTFSKRSCKKSVPPPVLQSLSHPWYPSTTHDITDTVPCLCLSLQRKRRLYSVIPGTDRQIALHIYATSSFSQNALFTWYEQHYHRWVFYR